MKSRDSDTEHRKLHADEVAIFSHSALVCDIIDKELLNTITTERFLSIYLLTTSKSIEMMSVSIDVCAGAEILSVPTDKNYPAVKMRFMEILYGNIHYINKTEKISTCSQC